MASFSGFGIGLSLVFGCLFLAVVAELFYQLWWKKRINHSNNGKESLIQLFCWKKPSSLQSTNNQESERGQINANANDHSSAGDLELGRSKDLQLKALVGDESEVSELMRLHNLAGPPRFLFTIKEETNEDLDLESDDGKSKGDVSARRSISDLIVTIDSPFLAPLASPRVKSTTLNALDSYHHHHQNGFNPLFGSSTEAELNRLRSSSPPPKFKFLRDADEKLLKRLMIEEAEKRVKGSSVKTLNTSSNFANEVTEGSFLKFIVGGHHLQQYPSSTSQVLPLASSPATLRPVLDQKPTLN